MVKCEKKVMTATFPTWVNCILKGRSGGGGGGEREGVEELQDTHPFSVICYFLYSFHWVDGVEFWDSDLILWQVNYMQKLTQFQIPEAYKSRDKTPHSITWQAVIFWKNRSLKSKFLGGDLDSMHRYNFRGLMHIGVSFLQKVSDCDLFLWVHW